MGAGASTSKLSPKQVQRYASRFKCAWAIVTVQGPICVSSLICETLPAVSTEQVYHHYNHFQNLQLEGLTASDILHSNFINRSQKSRNPSVEVSPLLQSFRDDWILQRVWSCQYIVTSSRSLVSMSRILGPDLLQTIHRTSIHISRFRVSSIRFTNHI